MVVDLPEPFGPRKPCTSPVRTVRSSPSRARTRPKVLTTPFISIAGLPVMTASILMVVRCWPASVWSVSTCAEGVQVLGGAVQAVGEQFERGDGVPVGDRRDVQVRRMAIGRRGDGVAGERVHAQLEDRHHLGPGPLVVGGDRDPTVHRSPQVALGVVDQPLPQSPGEVAAFGDRPHDEGRERRQVRGGVDQVQGVAGAQVGRGVPGQLVDQVGDVGVARLPQPVLGAEVMDDQGGRDVGVRGDRPHGRRPVSVPADVDDRRVPDPGPGGQIGVERLC